MTDGWNQWIGHVVDGKFPLRLVVVGSSHFAAFATEATNGGPAVIKLIRADADNAVEQVDSWDAAAKLSHPNLIRTFATGNCQLAEARFPYAVMERGAYDLSQMLAERALTPAEAEEMLRPMMKVLQYLHGGGLSRF
jgi:hypothetical protein